MRFFRSYDYLTVYLLSRALETPLTSVISFISALLPIPNSTTSWTIELC